MRRIFMKLQRELSRALQRKRIIFQPPLLKNKQQNGEKLERQRAKFARVDLAHEKNTEIRDPEAERPHRKIPENEFHPPYKLKQISGDAYQPHAPHDLRRCV